MSIFWPRSFSVLIAIILLGSVALAAPARASGGDDFVPDEVMVKLVRAADLPAVATAYQLDPTPIAQFGSRPIYLLRITNKVSPSTRAAALAADPRVVYAEPNYIGQPPGGGQDYIWATGGDVTIYATQSAAAVLRLPQAHAVTRGANVTVAVLDTGVDTAHPALAGRLLPGYDFVDMDDDPSEVGTPGRDAGYGHGTHVAGLVALAAPDAKIMPVRVLDQRASGNLWVLAEALRYAADPDGDPATRDGADVINLSLSTTLRSDLLEEVLEAVTCAGNSGSGASTDEDVPAPSCLGARGRGAVVTAAAGNGGDTTPRYPAADGTNGLLAVGASTSTDTLAPFSNHGSWVRVLAPGDRVLSSVPGGGFGSWSGTSMAAPLAAGEAALIRAACPQMGAVKVVQRIRESAARIEGAVSRRIDAAAALKGGCEGNAREEAAR